MRQMRQLTVAVLLGITLVLGVSTADQAQTTGFATGLMPANGPNGGQTTGFAHGVIPANGPSGAEASRRIYVTGTTQISAPPNEMIASFSVTTTAPSVDECTLAQARKTDRLVQALKKRSGAAAKITAGSFTLFPYAMPALTAAAPTPIPLEWVFFATVTAYADSLPTIGKVIDAAMAAGATGVGSTGFGAEPTGAPPAVFNPDYAGGPGSGGRGAPKTKPFASMDIRVAAESASECTSRGSAITDRVKRAIKDALGGKGTVRVAMFQVNQMARSPRYGYQQRPQSPPRQGFRAHNTVQVETKDLGRLGAIITAGMGAGADHLDSVQFTLSNDSPVREEAVDRATQDAKAKAATVAKSMGVKLGDVMSISTNTFAQPQNVYGGQSGAFALAQTPGTRMAIRSGQVGFSANVTVAYAIK